MGKKKEGKEKKDKKSKKEKKVNAPTNTTPAVAKQEGKHPINMIKGSINLSAFKGYTSKVKNKDGKKVDVLVVALDANYLEKHKNGNIYFNFVAWAQENEHSTHSIKQSFSKEVSEEMKKMDKEDRYALCPFFGNLSAFFDSDYIPTEANNTAEAENLDMDAPEGEDDLPF